MKNFCKILLTLCAALGLLALTGCPGMFDPPVPETSGGLTVTVTGEGSTRTALPSPVFDKYELTFAGPGGATHAPVTIDSGNTKVIADLTAGQWTITAKGYVKIGSNEPAVAAEGQNTITVNPSQPQNLAITISASIDSSKNGTFTYAITFPAFATGELGIYLYGGGPDDGETVNLAAAASGSVTLPSGYYLMTVRLASNDGRSAGVAEIVHIYPNMETKVEYEFADNDFAFHTPVTNITGVPTQAAAGVDLTLAGTVVPADATNKTITWSLADAGTTNATITNGVFRATATGTASVTATIVNGATVATNYTQNFNITVQGTGTYSGKDVLGNTYSLYVGSDAAGRAALRNDRYRMEVRTRDGKNRWVAGTVTNISDDGTLTLEPDDTDYDAFTANVDGDDLNSVAGSGGDIAQIPLTDGTTTTTITPRTFDEIYLRANRWTNGTTQSGEQWASGMSVLVKDFPTNVSNLVKNTSDRYSITISGTSDVALNFLQIEVQGLDEDDNWNYLGGFNSGYKTITANVPFSEKVNLNIGNESYSYNLMDYKEVILQVTNVLKYSHSEHPDWNANNGSLGEIPNGQIMATISDFKIVLKDAQKEALAGNMSDYTYGFGADGLSVAYDQAIWHLSAEAVAAAQQPGAKFEFIMLDEDDIYSDAPALAFIWQDPVRGLWWQDAATISQWPEGGDSYQFFKGTTWEPWRKKMMVDLSQVIEDPQFASATELNFIIACWWGKNGTLKNIDELGIGGANIFVSPSPTAGNMGNYSYGYKSDGISTEDAQAVWHLPSDTLEIAQEDGAQLEIVFNRDLTEYSPALYLVWNDIATERWWPTEAEAGTSNENLLIINYRDDAYAGRKPGVTYHAETKKLTIVLENSLETYIGFINATNVNLILICWYGITDSINELGIVSANIISGGGGGDTPVTFNSVTADGSASQTTTQLTLTLSAAITGLTADDITLSGVSGVSKGTLSGSGPTYTLPISGFTAGGTLSVAVAKTGYAVSGSPKTATIYYYSGAGAWIDPATQTTQLTGGTTLLSYTGGNQNLSGSPYGYEAWDFSQGSGSTNTFTWYGANQGGGGAFKATWTDYFLARLGYYWGNGGAYTTYNNIYVDYNFNRSNNTSSPSGGFIGVYGWSRNPSASQEIEKLIEYYIVDDWFWDGQCGPQHIGGWDSNTNQCVELGSFIVDGATYKIYKNPRINEPSIDGDKTFIQIFSVRQGRRTSGTISVTEHFKAWSKYITLGSMYEAKFKVEAFGTFGQGTCSGNLDLTYLYLSQEVTRRNIPAGTTPVDSTAYAPSPAADNEDYTVKVEGLGLKNNTPTAANYADIWFDLSPAFPAGFNIMNYDKFTVKAKFYDASNVEITPANGLGQIRFALGNAYSGGSWLTKANLTNLGTSATENVGIYDDELLQTPTMLYAQNTSDTVKYIEITEITFHWGSSRLVVVSAPEPLDEIGIDGFTLVSTLTLNISNFNNTIWAWTANDQGEGYIKGRIDVTRASAIKALTGGKYQIYWVMANGLSYNGGIGSFGGQSFNATNTTRGIVEGNIDSLTLETGGNAGQLNLNTYNSGGVVKILFYQADE